MNPLEFAGICSICGGHLYYDYICNATKISCDTCEYIESL